MATFDKSNFILNLFLLSVLAAPNFFAAINCFTPTFHIEIDQLFNDIFGFFVWNICKKGGKVISCYWQSFLITSIRSGLPCTGQNYSTTEK